ncbi:SDR family oxidoreductase [Phaeacidiphilus oryzae]|uniref:SDR family oxidoreductase n=1 Tax=Phaeacidiphilus oryzae TaxID=348818 RepID=UPI00055F487A|nr:SDR family oxidoreductase [Phaeacidiphilus oryzae]
MDLGLQDRVYIVTAASRGLGLATAHALVADGAKVVVTGREQDTLDQAVAELGGLDQALGVVADNGAEDTPGRLIGAAKERFGRLDGVLISVGGPPAGPALGATDEQWRSAFETVFLGAVRLARSVAAELGEGGAIGFVLSSSVRQPLSHLGISNGLRPGLGMVAKTLADELGPRGIRVFGLLPGRIDTERVRALDALSGDPEKARETSSAAIPLGRYGAPEEFGRAAAFLLSPAAGYLTGLMLPVDGGLLRGL